MCVNKRDRSTLEIVSVWDMKTFVITVARTNTLSTFMEGDRGDTGVGHMHTAVCISHTSVVGVDREVGFALSHTMA